MDTLSSYRCFIASSFVSYRILRAGVQPTLDPYAKAFLYQAHCVNPGEEESG